MQGAFKDQMIQPAQGDTVTFTTLWCCGTAVLQTFMIGSTYPLEDNFVDLQPPDEFGGFWGPFGKVTTVRTRTYQMHARLTSMR